MVVCRCRLKLDQSAHQGSITTSPSMPLNGVNAAIYVHILFPSKPTKQLNSQPDTVPTSQKQIS